LTFHTLEENGDDIMVHYFSENNDNLKSNQQLIAFSVNNVELKFKTDNGVFSKNNLDRGTAILLKYLKIEESYKTALDLGCGYGVIGIYLSKAFKMSVEMVDINKRAINLTTENIELNKVKATAYLSDGFENVKSKFDLIITNPPIRAGKKVIYQFFEDAKKYLNQNGVFYTVINKKHGAKSALLKLETVFDNVIIVKKEKGFNVIECKM